MWISEQHCMIYCGFVINYMLKPLYFLSQGHWASSLPSPICQWLQYGMGSIIGGIVDTRFSIYNLHWWKNIRPETWKWNLSFDIHQHYIILACIIWQNNCTGISRWKLRWTSYDYLVIFPIGPWYCVCPGKRFSAYLIYSISFMC